MITIREARKQAKLTQKQLSERYNIPHRTLQDWETGKHTPPEYIINLLLRCIAIDFGIKLEAKIQIDNDNSNAKTYIFTYSDGRPLSLVDEMYARTEGEAKRVEIIKADETGKVKTYQCSNGFIFIVTAK